jgi:hypothetical protein
MTRVDGGGFGTIPGNSWPVKQSPVAAGSVSGLSVAAIQEMFSFLPDGSLVSESGAAHTRAGAVLAGIADQLVKHVQVLSENWGGAAAQTAVTNFQQLHETASSLAQASTQTGAVLTWLGPVISSYKNYTASIASTSAGKQAAQAALSEFNQNLVDANSNLPTTITKNLPNDTLGKQVATITGPGGGVAAGTAAAGASPGGGPSGVGGGTSGTGGATGATGGSTGGTTGVAPGGTGPTGTSPGTSLAGLPPGGGGSVPGGTTGTGVPGGAPPGGTPGGTSGLGPAPTPAGPPGGSAPPGDGDGGVPGGADPVPAGEAPGGDPGGLGGVPGDGSDPGGLGGLPGEADPVPIGSVPSGGDPGGLGGVPGDGSDPGGFGGVPGDGADPVPVGSFPGGAGGLGGAGGPGDAGGSGAGRPGLGEDFVGDAPGDGAVVGPDGMIGPGPGDLGAGMDGGVADGGMGAGNSGATGFVGADDAVTGPASDSGGGMPMSGGPGSGERGKERRREAWMTEDADLWEGNAEHVPSQIGA